MNYQIQKARRAVLRRIRPFKAILGDASGNPYGDPGMYRVTRLDRADTNNIATTGVSFQVRAGSAIIVPRAGRVVWVGQGFDGYLTVLGFDHDDLTSVGIDARSAQPNDPYRQWVRLKDIQNFRALPVGTTNSPSMLIQVRQFDYLTPDGVLTHFNGTNASTHIDPTAYVPGEDLQRYILLWIDTYLNQIFVAASTIIDSLNTALTYADLQECAAQVSSDGEPIAAFRLANGQTSLKIDDTVDVDLRQFFNVPQVYGFPNEITRLVRIHDDYSVVMPDGVIIETGGGIQIQDGGGLVVIDTTDETGSGTVTSVTATAPLTSSGGAAPNIALTTPLSAAFGGTGLTSPTAHDLLLTNGASAMNLLAPGTSRNVVISDGTDFTSRGLLLADTPQISFKGYVRCMTAAALPASTYNIGTAGVGATITANANGVLTIDGLNIVLNDRVLVNNQGSTQTNGIYLCTQQGTAGAPFILTRATDADTSEKIFGSSVYITAGSTNLRKLVSMQTTDIDVMGVMSIKYTQSGIEPFVDVSHGGTGVQSLTAHDLLVGDGTNAVKFLAPGVKGNIVTSDGTDWIAKAAGNDEYSPVADSTQTDGWLWAQRLPRGFRSPDGLSLKKRDNATLEIYPGMLEVAGVLVEYTSLTTLGMATNGNWIGGTSAEAASEYVWVYSDNAGNLKLHNKAPNYPRASTATRQATMLVNQAGWNGTSGNGLNATSVTYDNDSGEGNVTAGMLALIYGSSDSDYSLGRGRGSGAGSTRNAVSAAYISAINTGTNVLTLTAGHNIAINDNDRIAVVDAGALMYRQESGVWYRLIGSMFNDGSSNLDDTRQDSFGYWIFDGGGDYTTTSTSFADIDSANLSRTVFTRTGKMLVSFGGTIQNTTGETRLNLSVDGIEVASDQGVMSAAGTATTTSYNDIINRLLTGLLPGTHEIRVRWKVSAGTSTIFNGTTAAKTVHPQFYVSEYT